MKTYLVKNPIAVKILSIIDAVLPDCQKAEAISPPSSILISNIAHIGDAVITTSIIRMLQDACPQIKIGVLCGSWSADVFKHHGVVVHTVDHWKLNRSEISFWEKYQKYRKSSNAALKQIREQKYDAAIDLYPYFPNSIPLLMQAKIPVRIGYESGGFGPLLTHRLPTVDFLKGAAENFAFLVRKFLPFSFDSFSPRPDLPTKEVKKQDYLVLHMGTGYALKEWPEENWKELAIALDQRGEKIVFTGRGKREKERILRVMEGLAGAVDLCDQLDWEGLVMTMKGAKGLISVDSVSGHIASAFEIPSVILISGINAPLFWKPPGSQTLMRAMPCAPCLVSKGCGAMSCIREISVGEVLNMMEKLF